MNTTTICKLKKGDCFYLPYSSETIKPIYFQFIRVINSEISEVRFLNDVKGFLLNDRVVVKIPKLEEFE